MTKQKIARIDIIIKKAASSPPKISTEDQDRRLLNYLWDHPFETAIKAKEKTNFSGSANTARDRVPIYKVVVLLIKYF